MAPFWSRIFISGLISRAHKISGKKKEKEGALPNFKMFLKEHLFVQMVQFRVEHWTNVEQLLYVPRVKMKRLDPFL